MNDLPIEFLYNFNIKEYSESLKEMKFEQQEKIIKNYIKWYFSINDHSFRNRMISKQNFIYRRIILSPDGKLVAKLDYDWTLEIDNENKECILRINDNNIDSKNLRFSYDSQYFAFYDISEKAIYVWDLTQKERSYSIKEKPKFMTFSKRDYYLGIIMEDSRSINLYHKERIVNATELFIDAIILDFAHSSNNNSLICIAARSSIYIWDFLKNEIVKHQDFDANITLMRFSPSDRKILLATQKNIIVIWEYPKKRTNKKISFPTIELIGHSYPIENLLFSNNEKYLYSTEATEQQQTNIFFWDVDNMNGNDGKPKFLIKKFLIKGRIAAINCFKSKLEINNYDNSVRSFDPTAVRSFDPTASIHMEEESVMTFGDQRYPIAYSHDGKFVAKALEEKVNIFSIGDQNDNKKSILRHGNVCVKLMAFSRDNKEIAIVFEEEICMYDLQNREDPTPVYHTSITNVKIIKYFRKNEILIGKGNGDLILFEKRDKISELKQIKFSSNVHFSEILVLAYDKKELSIASGDLKGIVAIWNSQSKQNLGKPIETGKDRIINFVFYGDNNIIIANEKGLFSSIDLKKNTINKIFNIFEGQEVKENFFPSSFDLAFNESKIAICHKNGMISLWNFEGKHLNDYNFYNYTKESEKYSIEANFHEKSSQILIVKSNECIKTFTITMHQQNLVLEPNEKPLILTSKNNLIKINKDNNTIKFDNISTGEEASPKIQLLKEKLITRLFISADESKLFVIDKEFICLYEIKSGECLKTSLRAKNHNEFFIANENVRKKESIIVCEGNIYRWKNDEKNFLNENEQLQLYKDLSSGLTNIQISFDDKYLLAEINNEKILIFHKTTHTLHGWEPCKTVEKIENSLLMFSGFFSINNNFFSFIYDELNDLSYIGIWEFDDLDLRKTPCKKIEKIVIDPKTNNLFLLNSDNELNLMKFSDEIIICLANNEKEKIQNYFINEKNDLLICFENRIEILFDFYTNPNIVLKKNNILRALTQSHEKEKIIENSINNNNFEEILKAKIFPFNYNFLQILAYSHEYRYEEILNELTQKKKIKIPFELFFEEDIHERNSFEIAYKSKNTKLFRNFLRYLKTFEINKLPEKYREYLNSRFFKRLFLMFEDNIEVIQEFLDFVFYEPIDFPTNFLNRKLNKPLLEVFGKPSLTEERLKSMLNENFAEKLKRKIFSWNRYQQKLKDIVKAKCFFAYQLLDHNNKNTKSVFKLISHFEPTNEIFSNEAICSIANYKWEKYAMWIYHNEALFFLIFLVIYLVNAEYIFVARIMDRDNEEYKNLSIGVNILLLVFLFKYITAEIAQVIFFGVKDYLVSVWNINDIIYLMFTTVSTELNLLFCYDLYNDTTTLKLLHSISIFSAFFRLLSFSRSYEGSSFMIKLITQVLWDIRYFLILLVGFILSLTFSSKKFFLIL